MPYTFYWYNIQNMKWTVTEKTGLHKRVRKLPEKVQNLLIALKKDLEANGPVRGDWPNSALYPAAAITAI